MLIETKLRGRVFGNILIGGTLGRDVCCLYLYFPPVRVIEKGAVNGCKQDGNIFKKQDRRSTVP
jgi:hypothetical protein